MESSRGSDGLPVLSLACTETFFKLVSTSAWTLYVWLVFGIVFHGRDGLLELEGRPPLEWREFSCMLHFPCKIELRAEGGQASLPLSQDLAPVTSREK
jgi:hypothetical protein